MVDEVPKDSGIDDGVPKDSGIEDFESNFDDGDYGFIDDYLEFEGCVDPGIEIDKKK